MTAPRTGPARSRLYSIASPAAALAVSPHHLATRAALEAIDVGGNAVDAAIAANAVQGVVAPHTCGIGGDLFALIHRPGETAPLALNASGRAGSGTTAAALRDDHVSIPLRHAATITTPGCIDGWIALSTRLGRIQLSDTLAPAIRIAEDGFPASIELATAADRIAGLIGDQPSAGPLYPSGRPVEEGATVRRPRLAATLRAIADSGRAAFYDGPVAAAIVGASEGILTLDDLGRQNADWVDPISVDVFGSTAWTIPPNTQGYLALAAAWIFEQLDPPTDPSDPAFHHAAIEAYRSIAWERDDVVADATTAPLPVGSLLDTDRLSTFVSQIDMTRASRFPAPSPKPGGTAYLCVRDQDGMGVSLIQSNFWGIGSGRSAGDTGVFLHNRGAGFNLVPGHPNEYSPGRRPLHTLSPTLWTRAGELHMLLGTRGGQFQPQILVQLIAALLHGKTALDAAQAAPRWQVTGWEKDREPVVRLEAGFAEDVARGLRDRGHTVEDTASPEPGWGPVSIILETSRGVQGAADPRISTSSARAMPQ